MGLFLEVLPLLALSLRHDRCASARDGVHRQHVVVDPVEVVADSGVDTGILGLQEMLVTILERTRLSTNL